jgi:hypothetical protein
MNEKLTPIRNEAPSLALVALRLLYDWFFLKRQIAFIEAVAARGPAIHARKLTRAAAGQSRFLDALRKASQPLGQRLKFLKGVQA